MVKKHGNIKLKNKEKHNNLNLKKKLNEFKKKKKINYIYFYLKAINTLKFTRMQKGFLGY